MKYKCLECGKKNKDKTCIHCGLYDANFNLNIYKQLSKIDELLCSHNKKLKYYKLDNTMSDYVVFYPKGLYLLFNWIYDEWINLTLSEIEAFRFLLSYLENNRNLNISEYAVFFFGYMSIYNSEFIKYYKFWKKKAIKIGSYLAIKWAINDLEIEGKQSLRLRKQSCKLSSYPTKC